MGLRVTFGNIVNAKTEVIVNAWNCNFIPWYLLLPMGISRAIKKHAGYKPFNELLSYGLFPKPMRRGDAVMTSAGRLPYKAIIHVAGLTPCWVATKNSVQRSVRKAMEIVNRENFASVAFPVIGAGTGGFKQDEAVELMKDQLARISTSAEVEIIRFDGSPKIKL